MKIQIVIIHQSYDKVRFKKNKKNIKVISYFMKSVRINNISISRLLIKFKLEIFVMINP